MALDRRRLLTGVAAGGAAGAGSPRAGSRVRPAAGILHTSTETETALAALRAIAAG